MRLRRFSLLLFLVARCAAAAVAIDDEHGDRVRLERPAARIISFAPHITELLYAIGAGERIVGVVKHSDYPEEAKRIAQVGDNRAADLERIVALQPDLIVAWLHAGAMKQLGRLRSTGIPVYYSDPRTLEAIAREGERLGALAGTGAQASLWAQRFRERHRRLAALYAARPKVTVFYEVWSRPLQTLNREHFVSDLLSTCGATNVFAALPVVAPAVSVEAVLKENPRAIIGAVPDAELRAQWSKWRQMDAVRRGNIFSVDADLTHRAGPRAIDAAEILCAKIDQARRP